MEFLTAVLWVATRTFFAIITLEVHTLVAHLFNFPNKPSGVQPVFRRTVKEDNGTHCDKIKFRVFLEFTGK